jgi:hypothetical protein
MPDRSYWHGVYNNAPPYRETPIEAFAEAVHAVFPSVLDAFDAFDTNCNGTICMTEFQAGAESIGYRGDIAHVFKELDTRRRGFLNRNDFSLLQHWAPQSPQLSLSPPSPPRRREVQPLQRRWSSPQIQAGDALRQWVPQQQAQDYAGYYDPRGMPPAGINPRDFPRRQLAWNEPGTVPRELFRREQRSSGVSAALGSWGEWRKWQESDHLGRLHDYTTEKSGYRAWEYPSEYYEDSQGVAWPTDPVGPPAETFIDEDGHAWRRVSS